AEAPAASADAAPKKAGLLAGALARHKAATPQAADIKTTVEAAQTAPATVPASAAPAPSTTKEGIDSLNTEGSYDHRLGKVQQIRNDILTGSQDYISPDVSPEVIEDTKPALGP